MPKDYKGVFSKSQENRTEIKLIIKMLEALTEIGLTAYLYVFIVVFLSESFERDVPSG
jgi:hypothetical protein